MRFVFAGTGYWIAVLDTDDVLHHIAQEMSDTLRGVRILTTDMVLVEVASHFAGFGPGSREAVAALLHDIGQSEDVEVVPQTRALLRPL